MAGGNNELLINNDQSRLNGSVAFSEATNVSFKNYRRGYNRGCGRGSGCGRVVIVTFIKQRDPKKASCENTC